MLFQNQTSEYCVVTDLVGPGIGQSHIERIEDCAEMVDHSGEVRIESLPQHHARVVRHARQRRVK